MTGALPGFETPVRNGHVTVAIAMQALTKERLLSIARSFGLDHLSPRSTKAQLASDVGEARPCGLSEVLGLMLREELRESLRSHDLDDSGRSRRDLANRLLTHSAAAADASAGDADPAVSPGQPRKGRLDLVRRRQYLITGVYPPPDTDEPTPTRPIEPVQLVCLDDDAQGSELDVFRPLQLGARVIEPAAEGWVPSTVSTPPPTSRPSCTRCAGTRSLPRTTRSSSRPFAPAPSFTITRICRFPKRWRCPAPPSSSRTTSASARPSKPVSSAAAQAVQIHV